MNKRAMFENKVLPYVLLAPQIFVTLAFFIWPSVQAIWQSLIIEDAFGGNTKFVWFANFEALFEDPAYLASVKISFIFSIAVTVIGLSTALLLAAAADRKLRGASTFRTFIIWPYAVAPAVAGVLWGFLFNPRVGVLPYLLNQFGILEWNHRINPDQALILIVLAACWNQIGYNFIFFMAGLHAIPRSLLEAAAIDGAGPIRRFWAVTFPLLSPTTFFLLVVNVIYAFFSTFGLIDALTRGGPAGSTQILVYKVFVDGFRNQDFGSSAAQSTILTLIVVVLTVIQFRFIERRVHY
jgi:sn-glycerol 3-phosphate transport system permease protein